MAKKGESEKMNPYATWMHFLLNIWIHQKDKKNVM